jgi:hypothetical protein
MSCLGVVWPVGWASPAGRAVALRVEPHEAVSRPCGLPSLTPPRLAALRAALAGQVRGRWPRGGRGRSSRGSGTDGVPFPLAPLGLIPALAQCAARNAFNFRSGEERSAVRCGAAARQSGDGCFQAVCQPTPLACRLSRRWRSAAGRPRHLAERRSARAVRPFRKSPHKPPGWARGTCGGINRGTGSKQRPVCALP